MNLLLLLTAFMASLTGMLTGERALARVASVAEVRLGSARVAARPAVVADRPAASPPVAARVIDGPVLTLAATDLIVRLGRRLV